MPPPENELEFYAKLRAFEREFWRAGGDS